MTLTDAEIGELRRRATDERYDEIAGMPCAENINRLLDEVTRARALLRRMNGEDYACPDCGSYGAHLAHSGDREHAHKPGCELAALIGAR